MKQVLAILAAAGLFVLPAAATAHPAPEVPRITLGVKLLEAPVERKDDPRASSYIVDHLAPGSTIHRRVEVANDSSEPSQGTKPPPTRALADADLTISVPVSANLGAASPGSTHSARLGTVTVTGHQETEGSVTVTATTLTTTGGTIPTSDIAYWSGPTTDESSPGTCQPGQSSSGNQVTLNAARTAFSCSGSSGNESCSWNPTVAITVPANAPVGQYTGVITHSAA
ncbi:hypothetical protein [Streptomyces sp. NPDC088816]|uniref:hypothetical protein n=1 Tax=Streptomyces sp. NPDC088816 TaxID=3365906 RepID=UPI0038302D47